jgi:hypothetical protein
MDSSKKNKGIFMVFVVGLAGPGHVGKSTTAKALVSCFNKYYPGIKPVNTAFAGPLYQVASLLTGIAIELLKDEVYKETPWTETTAPMPSLINWTPRKFLQIIGTECFRQNVGENFWIETTFQQISKYDIAFLEDARFVNEFKFCDMVIELERDGVEYAMNHLSAMPPPAEYVDKKIKLYDGIDFLPTIKEIMNKLFRHKTSRG